MCGRLLKNNDFQISGAHFLYFDYYTGIRQGPGGFIPKTLQLSKTSCYNQIPISHHGGLLTEKEMTLTLENMLILPWLQLIYPSLPKLVKQCYGTELRSCTLVSIKPEISQALESLLEKLSNNMSVNWAFTTHQNTKKLYETLKSMSTVQSS